MNDGEIKLAQGEAQLNSSQQQLDSSKEQAKEAANIKNKLTVANVKALLTAQNFEMRQDISVKGIHSIWYVLEIR